MRARLLRGQFGLKEPIVTTSPAKPALYARVSFRVVNKLLVDASIVNSEPVSGSGSSQSGQRKAI